MAKHGGADTWLWIALGGAVVALTGDDLVRSVLDYARQGNLTQIVVGKSRRRGRLLRPSLIAALLDSATGAAVHVITESADSAAAEPPPRPRGPLPWRGHLGALASVCLSGLVAYFVDRYAQSANLAMVFMLSVLVSGLMFGLWPAVLAAALSAFAYNFFFLEPRLSLTIGHAADLFTFGVFFVVALTTGWLTGRVRDQARAVSRRASGIAAVLTATRRLSSAAGAQDAAIALAEQLAAATSARAVVLTPTGDDIGVAAASPPLDTLSPGDMAAARWAWEKGEPAGAGTGTLPNAAWTFRPLQGVRSRAGGVSV
jgi:two-component system sensor histidine kinase KdpD